MCAHHGKALADNAGNQPVDETVFRAPQRGHVEPARCQKMTRISRAAMGGIEKDRSLPCLGLKDLERRVEFVADFVHRAKTIEKLDFLELVAGFNAPLYRLLFMAGPQSQVLVLVHS